MPLRSIKLDPTSLLVLGLVIVLSTLVVLQVRSGGGGGGTLVAPAATQAATQAPAPEQPGLPAPPEATTGPPERTGPTRPATAKPTRTPRRDLRKRGPVQCVETGTSADLTVLSYNIKSGQGAGTLPQIADVLRASEADVILLQEVDRLRYSSGRVDMPAYFSTALEMPYAFGRNVPHADGGSYGTAILSRFPILEVVNSPLPRPGATQQRGLLHAVLDVDGVELSVYNTHLQNADEPARMLQVAAINRLTAADPRPQILGGDMNATPSSRPMAVLGASWTDTWAVAGSGLGQTAPAGNPRARIDYLLYGGEGLTPLATDVLTSFASDHRPVRAAYRLDDPGKDICFQNVG